MKEKLKILFENLCCATCKSGFDEDSMDITRYESGLVVVRVTCRNCGMSFGLSFLGLSGLAIKEPLEAWPAPITCDDVIDAHKFIKELDGNWQNYLPKPKSQSETEDRQ